MRIISVNGGQLDTDVLVSISANDTTPGYLNGKLVAGSNITLTEGNDGGDEILTITGTATDTKADFIASFPAGSWNLPATNYAEPERDDGTNGSIWRHLFDDSTEEFVIGDFVVPSDIDTDSNVTFELFGYAVTADTNKYVAFTVYHSAKANGESWDDTYATKTSGDVTTHSTQDQLDRKTFESTVEDLGWVANDHVRIKLGRTSPAGDNLSGDYGLVLFRIWIPRT